MVNAMKKLNLKPSLALLMQGLFIIALLIPDLSFAYYRGGHHGSYGHYGHGRHGYSRHYGYSHYGHSRHYGYRRYGGHSYYPNKYYRGNYRPPGIIDNTLDHIQSRYLQILEFIVIAMCINNQMLNILELIAQPGKL